jgi:hypothetical protein
MQDKLTSSTPSFYPMVRKDTGQVKRLGGNRTSAFFEEMTAEKVCKI